MNKKGQAGRQLLVFTFLIMLLLIGGGIVGGVLAFFGKGYEFRQAESDILNYKVKGCILNNEIDWAADDFYEICRLSKNNVEQNNFIKIYVDGSEAFDNRVSDETKCGLVEKSRGLPRCTINEFVVSGKSYKVITSSSQDSRSTG